MAKQPTLLFQNICKTKPPRKVRLSITALVIYLLVPLGMIWAIAFGASQHDGNDLLKWMAMNFGYPTKGLIQKAEYQRKASGGFRFYWVVKPDLANPLKIQVSEDFWKTYPEGKEVELHYIKILKPTFTIDGDDPNDLLDSIPLTTDILLGISLILIVFYAILFARERYYKINGIIVEGVINYLQPGYSRFTNLAILGYFYQGQPYEKKTRVSTSKVIGDSVWLILHPLNPSKSILLNGNGIWGIIPEQLVSSEKSSSISWKVVAVPLVACLTPIIIVISVLTGSGNTDSKTIDIFLDFMIYVLANVIYIAGYIKASAIEKKGKYWALSLAEMVLSLPLFGLIVMNFNPHLLGLVSGSIDFCFAFLISIPFIWLNLWVCEKLSGEFKNSN
jgi:hypothetical protein